MITKRGKAVAQLTTAKTVSPDDWRGAMRDRAISGLTWPRPAVNLDEWAALRG